MTRLMAGLAVALALSTVGCALDSAPQIPSQRRQLVGAWKLISAKQVRTDGSSADLYGSPPSGELIYDSRGHMSVHLLTPNLPKCGTQDRRRCPDPAARSAFDNYFGYWGRYEFPDAHTVVHVIEGASVSDWIGVRQQRSFEVSGDQLTLATPLQQIAGVESKLVLVWQRDN